MVQQKNAEPDTEGWNRGKAQAQEEKWQKKRPLNTDLEEPEMPEKTLKA